MGASLEVILANLWMKSPEPQSKLQTPKGKTKAQMTTCRNCEHHVTARCKGVEFVLNGSMQNFSESVTQNMIAWKTSSRCAHTAVK